MQAQHKSLLLLKTIFKKTIIYYFSLLCTNVFIHSTILSFFSALQFHSSVVYRNCSQLESPTLECGVGNEKLLNESFGDFLGQVANLQVDLSQFNMVIEDLEGSVCYCDEDQCNVQVDAEDFGGDQTVSVESLTTVDPGGK